MSSPVPLPPEVERQLELERWDEWLARRCALLAWLAVAVTAVLGARSGHAPWAGTDPALLAVGALVSLPALWFAYRLTGLLLATLFALARRAAGWSEEPR